MTALNKISNFKKTIGFESSKRGDYTNLNYNPVFKSSAIFFVIFNKKINTKISFLNYWKIKNNNKDISCQITLRSRDGNKFLRKFFKIKLNTYIFSLKKLLSESHKIKEFIGTLEIELYSSYDLKYAFPAIHAFYETSKGVSLVHSNQRIFDNLLDNINNQSINQIQTGFDIYLDDKNKSFIAAINGPLEIKNKNLNIIFYNFKGNKFVQNVKYKNIKPYELIYINLDEFKSLKNFLKNQRGFCKVNLPTRNIFNRVLVGTFSKKKLSITTTHSYFDCSNTKDYVNLRKIKKDEYGCFLPFNLIKNINLEIVLYPIFSKSNLNFALERFDKYGNKKTINKNILSITKNFKDPKIICINDHIKDKENIENFIYCLNVTSKSSLVPSRLTFGFNYKKNTIGSNISDSMIINHGKSLKTRGFYWGPAFNSRKINTIIALSSFDIKKNVKLRDKINIKIYSSSGKIINKKFSLNSPEALNIDVKKILNSGKNKSHDEEIVWFTIESKLKSIVCKHVHISKHGHISADHSF